MLDFGKMEVHLKQRKKIYEKNKNLVLGTKTTITSIKNIDELECILKNNSFYSNEDE